MEQKNQTNQRDETTLRVEGFEMGSQEASGGREMSRRTLLLGGGVLGAVLAAGGGFGRLAYSGGEPLGYDSSRLAGVGNNLTADKLLRPQDQPPEEAPLPPVEQEPADEEPAEQAPKEQEPPAPATKGLELFKQKELPGFVIDRIKRENLPGKIATQRHIYDHVQKERGVPWQLMAAINYREASLRPSLSMLDGSPLTAGTSQDGVTIYNDAKKDAVKASEILTGNAKTHYGVDLANIDTLSEEDIAHAILAYNRGAMYLNNPGEPMPVSKSPYVYNYMNGEQMKWNRADSFNGSKRLNRVQGKTDGNLGALVVVTYLMQNP